MKQRCKIIIDMIKFWIFFFHNLTENLVYQCIFKRFKIFNLIKSFLCKSFLCRLRASIKCFVRLKIAQRLRNAMNSIYVLLIVFFELENFSYSHIKNQQRNFIVKTKDRDLYTFNSSIMHTFNSNGVQCKISIFYTSLTNATSY